MSRSAQNGGGERKRKRLHCGSLGSSSSTNPSVVLLFSGLFAVLARVGRHGGSGRTGEKNGVNRKSLGWMRNEWGSRCDDASCGLPNENFSPCTSFLFLHLLF